MEIIPAGFFILLGILLMFYATVWIQIGEVVDGPDDSMARPVLDGIQYDYG